MHGHTLTITQTLDSRSFTSQPVHTVHVQVHDVDCRQQPNSQPFIPHNLQIKINNQGYNTHVHFIIHTLQINTCPLPLVKLTTVDSYLTKQPCDPLPNWLYFTTILCVSKFLGIKCTVCCWYMCIYFKSLCFGNCLISRSVRNGTLLPWKYIKRSTSLIIYVHVHVHSKVYFIENYPC